MPVSGSIGRTVGVGENIQERKTTDTQKLSDLKYCLDFAVLSTFC